MIFWKDRNYAERKRLKNLEELRLKIKLRRPPSMSSPLNCPRDQVISEVRYIGALDQLQVQTCILSYQKR